MFPGMLAFGTLPGIPDIRGRPRLNGNEDVILFDLPGYRTGARESLFTGAKAPLLASVEINGKKPLGSNAGRLLIGRLHTYPSSSANPGTAWTVCINLHHYSRIPTFPFLSRILFDPLRPCSHDDPPLVL